MFLRAVISQIISLMVGTEMRADTDILFEDQAIVLAIGMGATATATRTFPSLKYSRVDTDHTHDTIRLTHHQYQSFISRFRRIYY